MKGIRSFLYTYCNKASPNAGSRNVAISTPITLCSELYYSAGVNMYHCSQPFFVELLDSGSVCSLPAKGTPLKLLVMTAAS